jgi:cell division protein FtsB
MSQTIQHDPEIATILSGIRDRADQMRTQGLKAPGIPPLLALANQRDVLRIERMRTLLSSHIQVAKDNAQLNNYFPSLERFGTVKRLLIKKIAKVVATVSRFIIRQQTVFNTNSIYSVSLVDAILHEQGQTIDRLNRRIDELEAKIRAK